MIRRAQRRSMHPLRAGILAVTGCLAATMAQAVDGGLPPPPSGGGDGGLSVPPSATYYEEEIQQSSWRATAEAALPSRLHIAEGDAFVEYRALRDDPRRTEWEVRVRNYQRRHETVDAIYDMVLVLPMPENALGGDAFSALDPGITLYEGDEHRATPAVYNGREVVLKRNLALERTLLPGLIQGAGDGKLPSLAGSGYRYTAWDTVVTHDPDYGAAVQGWASLRYGTEGRIVPPDADDERLAAYFITWIPTLTRDVLPYAVRIDVRD